MVGMTAMRAASTFGFVVCVLLGASQRANANGIELDNLVDVNWSRGGFDCDLFPDPDCPGPVTVIGAPRLVPDAILVGALVFIDVTDVSDDVNTMSIGLNVFDENATGQLAQIFAPEDIDFDTRELHFTLGQFIGFELLPAGNLIFSVFGTVNGSGQEGGQAPAVITVRGAGTEFTAVPVPEPTTLLLLGSGVAAIARKRIRRRNSPNLS